MPGRHLLYHKGTDHEAGTYITNYVGGSVFLLCALILLVKTCGAGGKREWRRHFALKNIRMIFIPSATVQTQMQFIFQGIAFISGGLVHEYFAHTAEYPGTPVGWHVFWRLSMIATAMAASHVLLLSEGIYYGESDVDEQRFVQRYNLCKCDAQSIRLYCILVVSVAVMMISSTVYLAWDPSLTIAGGYYAVTMLCLTVVSAVKMCRSGWSAVMVLLCLGSVIQNVSVVVQAAFASDCGVPTPADCPLSELCNHNCAFHLIFMIGMTVQFLGISMMSAGDAAVVVNERDRESAVEANISLTAEQV